MRLAFLFFILALLVLIPFLVWGDQFALFFSWDGARTWLEDWGSWAWAAGILLLILDLFLPLPNTIIIAGLGWKYGFLVGGILGAAGSILSGLLAYGLCRQLGHGAALRIAGAEGLEKGEHLFAKSGGWIVTLSRWLPMLPEIVACAAGLSRMPFRIYLLALACGNIPLGFVYAAVGHMGHENMALALGLSIFLPPALWLSVHPFLVRATRKAA